MLQLISIMAKTATLPMLSRLFLRLKVYINIKLE